ncbi:MAG: class A beta-lactamase-related serine hydrolase [Saprospiraceae bacterium]|nr:class A beta-lactamase-related serine hydrolase [Saprospiraceae bacterium]
MKPFIVLALLINIAIFSFGQENLIPQLIKENSKTLSAWAQNPDQYEIQVIYTQIDRDENNHPSFKSHYWKVNPNRYFYPASTVKMPAAIMALEKLNQLGIRDLDLHTPMRNFAATPPQSAVHIDTSAQSGLASIGHYIRKIFLVSDNDAHNRLYEFLGQRYFNESLHNKGYDYARLIHRLSVGGFDKEGNRYTNPVQFYDAATGAIIYHQGEVYSKFYPELGLEDEVRGKGYWDDEQKKVIHEAFDFRYKNAISLENLNDILRAVLFPEATPKEQQFDLSEEDYQWLYKAMYQYPKESEYPKYKYGDNYVKFWMYGKGEQNIPDHIRIFNKVGWAYGFLTDVAYIVDFETGTEFMLSGLIHVNKNQIFNDGQYEYENIGLPFFAELGKLIYEYDKARKRKNSADLSKFWIK